MRSFANLFLMLFCVDGITSLVTEIVFFLYPFPVLSGMRTLLANLVIFMAIPAYFSLGIDKRLPKRILLPLILFVFWRPLSTWFFPALADIRVYPLLMSAGQVVLCLLPVSHFRKVGRSLLVPPAQFSAPFFSLKNTLLFGGVNLFVIPVAVAIFALFTANAYTQSHISGFMRIGPDGIYMTERIYRRDNKTIRLAAMIHVGEKKYYDEVFGSFASGRTIVLAEGVSDRSHLLANKLDHAELARFLGLTPQSTMRFRGRLIDEEELDETPDPTSAKVEKDLAAPADIIRADVDVSSFRIPTIRLLHELGSHLKGNATIVKGLLSLNAWAEKNITQEMQTIIMDDILYARNKELLRYLRKALPRYDTIFIPWGALHMPEIEQALLNQGFELQQERERVSINWLRILTGKLGGP